MKGKKQGSVIRSMNWEGKRCALYDFLAVEQEIAWLETQFACLKNFDFIFK